MRIFNFVLALLFALFAVVQYNDPDPLRWILIYGYVAIISLFAAYRKYSGTLITLGIIICILWAISLFPSVRELFREHRPAEIVEGMQATRPYIEGSRESFGLFFAAAVLGFHLWSFRRLRRRRF